MRIAAGRTWSQARPSWHWTTSRRPFRTTPPTAMPTTAGGVLWWLGKYKEAVVEAEDALHHGEPTPRMLYVAARIYAQAADLAITKASRRTLGLPRISTEYTARAQRLLRRALKKLPAEKRAAFWRDVIQGDPTLRVILRHADFDELGRSFPATEPMKSPRSRPLAALSLTGPWR